MKYLLIALLFLTGCQERKEHTDPVIHIMRMDGTAVEQCKKMRWSYAGIVAEKCSSGFVYISSIVVYHQVGDANTEHNEFWLYTGKL